MILYIFVKINQNYSIEMTFSLSTLNQYAYLFSASKDSKNYVYRARYEYTKGINMKHGWYGKTIYSHPGHIHRICPDS